MKPASAPAATPLKNIFKMTSLCDVRSSDFNCSIVDIFVEKNRESQLMPFGGMCRLENLNSKETENSRYSLVTPNHLRCKVPQIWIDRTRFENEELKINIQPNYFDENGVVVVVQPAAATGESVTFTVYNSDCRICDETRRNSECRKKFGVCHLDGNCFRDGAKKPKDVCFVCKQGVWINEKRQFPEFKA